MSTIITVDDRAARALFREFPKIANAEVNKGYRRIIGDFMKDFTARRLVKGVFNARRKVRVKKTARGQPVIPAKARKAGFIATLAGAKALAGKSATARTSNPLLLVRERGEVIRAKRTRPGDKKPYLYIRTTPQKAFGRSSRGQSRKERWQKWRDSQRLAVTKRYARPIGAKVESVGPFPRLGFVSSWTRFRTQIPNYLAKVTSEIVRRGQLQLSRRAA